MKQIHLAIAIVMAAGPAACAQKPVLTSFSHNGELTWTNALVSNGWYTVEWAPAMNGTWRKSFQGLTLIEAQTGTSFTVSVPMFYRVVLSTNVPPAGMALIDAGWFRMGDTYGEGDVNERPFHDVHLSAFYMDKYELTNERMRQILQWAYDRGLIAATSASVSNSEGVPQTLVDLASTACQIDFSGGLFTVVAGKNDFPCIRVTWYGAQAACNYRSDMEGLSRCIDFADWNCDFTARGYRLPTEAEWEKAARGGLSGHHFPWLGFGGSYTDHLSGAHANYAFSGDPYESGSWPWTSPVGYFKGSQSPVGLDMANGYGLYDMAGNVSEWCWNWQAPYSGTNQYDPTGPTAGADRVVRGGSFNNFGNDARCANLDSRSPSTSRDDYGFRCVRRP